MQETYSANFGEIPHGDITKIPLNKIPKHDILCAGFPCQAFSISGKHLGFDDMRGTLFFEIARIAKHHKPKVLLLENVKSFVRHDKGKTLKTVLQILKSLNYDVFYKVLNASNFGVPTARERIYILGFRRDLNIFNFEFPKSKPQSGSLKQLLDIEELTSEYIINRKDVFFQN
jgi:DNA (cytosine-5)-methyltransferase 1